MAETFEGLGIRAELAEAMREAGYAGPTALQRAAIPVLRRGGNAVLNASAGAGVVAAYGVALLDRLAGAGAEEAGVRGLVLVPTPEAASRTAESLARFGRAVGLRVTALDGGWAAAPTEADVVVAATAQALEAVRTSRLKLERVEALVLDGAGTIFGLGQQEAVETLTGLVPREAQRVVVAGEPSREVEGYVERHVRRALRIPPTPIEEEAPREAPTRPIGYAVVAAGEKLEAVAVLLAERSAGQPAVVYCRTDRGAASLADDLALRGFAAAKDGGEEAEVTVTAEAATVPPGALAISFDVPFDAESLAARHPEGGVVLVEAREVPHLRGIARKAGYVPEVREIAARAPSRDAIDAFRAQLRAALAEEDLGAQLLVLEPLFEEYSPAEVAAAASALLRRRAPAPAEPAPTTRPPAAPPAFVRLFVSVGSRDGVGPGDLVGAITGEANVQGGNIGRIEIRDTFSIVEVAGDVAERVIQALNGITLRGRSLRVDYDRRPSPAARGPERPRRRIQREPGR
jgi:ATP-dependent RNA helicase DeaD